ncbi:MAG: type III restriction endonuclease subunit R [Nitrospirae bacterium CG_4_10_14_3_um_filter_44_29]|nr:MAG: type III restriction endonuclease subunit R [Nitrospirae bacterium CG01_land_8_20_14_3_00_44_22]PIW89716.1 MAG: type III restriction endonuclease subunit R [Nitrospirae bacterium CG_4_8_14_3_um_filter_44_28]PIX88623.1 MAG: type III restriction endonuclease subunit R [Nitrospirae bacterium CG_4_10_14_3_um_filter_44_29]
MDRIAINIKNRLSLRPPQTESLNILAELADKLSLTKTPTTPDPSLTKEGSLNNNIKSSPPILGGDKGVVNNELNSQLEIVRSAYPTCTDFERNFPSICFALATGVGKTRLMGAFVAYLYLAKGIKNFFVLAPNLTIYNKLIEDFSNSTHPKYVFQGIGEFVHNQPVIITGDNYTNSKLFDSDVHINIFNISKINAETRGGNAPRIKRLSEFLGESYFNYLSNLDDLVLLMDESHHYRANRGMEVINQLNPVIGLELTATPKIERSGGAIKFKNVVFEYSLAKAIQDGFVKEPAVATRKDFDPSHYSPEELDRIKLEDGVRIHEDTKVALDIYARDNKVNIIKPFVLVVAKDIDHARKLKELIVSSSFFEGYYADKVMEIHSNQTGEEKDDNISQLVSLENPNNKMEIVIHVNMLKEGWDVTNLYTIIPLRTSASETLTEQTIGRGLRLPYGKRTGDNKADKLTIVAHDKFQQIIDKANEPDSIIRIENIITIDPQELSQPKVVITSASSVEEKYKEEQKRIETITEPAEKQKAQISLDSKKSILAVLPEMSSTVTNITELKKDEIKQIVVEKVKEKIYSTPQQAMFAGDLIKEVEAAYDAVVDDFTGNIIEIPRISIQQSDEVISGFKDFDLDTRNLNLQPVSEEILRRTLRPQENDSDSIFGKGRIIIDSPEKIIVNELINHSEIDYDMQSDLLFKLAGQAMEKFKTYLDDDNLMNVVQSQKREIGSYIYSQMMELFYCKAPSYEKPIVKPFSKIEEHNFSKYAKDAVHDYRDTITPTNAIPSKVFSGFKKASHNLYKFDSKTEKDFAAILEQDKAVQKWLRPAQNQFHIYWEHNSKRYCPDFVVEAADCIYMVETKKEGDMESSDVQEKATAAIKYCNHATEFNLSHGKKPWKYVLIPHNAVLANMSFETLMRKYVQEDL